MEKINSLIDKLYQQKQQHSSPAHLLYTVHLLQSELSKLQRKNGSIGTNKVAVTLPTSFEFSENIVLHPTIEVKQEEVITKHQEPEVQKKEEQTQPANEENGYNLRKPAFNDFLQQAKQEVKEEPATAAVLNKVLNPAFDAVQEEEVIVHQRSQYVPQPATPTTFVKKEVHELISVQKESLNDRLKEEKRELGHALTGAPIKDLRKGIGINERFTLVQDLFRGDEDMYERSIRTINGFNIISEAEYWINRELKFKLGWNDTNETVQHFYQLVRRRFS